MKKILAGLISAAMACGMLVMPVLAENTNICDDSSIAPELKQAAGCPTDANPDQRNETIFPVVKTLIQVVFAVVGVLAVIVIIYGAVMYVISTGDASKVTKAKNVILYGIVGLVISLLAYSIVAFVGAGIATPAP